MKSLYDHNTERKQAWADKLRQVTNPEEFSNGIECPACGASLYDTGRVYPGPPTRMIVKCMEACGFRGEKIE